MGERLRAREEFLDFHLTISLSSLFCETVQSHGLNLILDRDVNEEVQDQIKGEKILSNGQLMALENGSKSFNIDERFWKTWLIYELIRKGADIKALARSVNVTSRIDRISEEEQKIWYANTTADLDEDIIQYRPWNAEESAKYDMHQAIFDSQDYQRENLEESCQTLGIPWDGEKTVLRMPGMNLSQSLKFWQPLAVNALIEFRRKTEMRACFLADHTGLGKIGITISYLLWLKNTREETPEHRRSPAKPRPGATCASWGQRTERIRAWMEED